MKITVSSIVKKGTLHVHIIFYLCPFINASSFYIKYSILSMRIFILVFQFYAVKKIKVFLHIIEQEVENCHKLKYDTLA